MCLGNDKAAKIARRQAQEAREAAAAEIASANRDTESSREGGENRLRKIASLRGFMSQLSNGGAGAVGAKMLTGQ